ncbi:flagellar type III secretion system protein FlhB [uncultured Tateyamaria sp.]|uniref:EscU/YscU/HrcU family type III secretion system export apparatus switch protein n=1 Tax=Tateyamaria sp. 1078 TaxID=3417464 RepID=UPI00260DEFD8|nr:flagellar type III secretion system protein FlhB [uncultured Tateyamaria sp.]
MSEQGDEQDKSFEPTPHKLQEARRKGEVAKSVDLQTAAGYAGLTLALIALGAQSFISLGSHLAGLLAQSEQIAEAVFDGGPVAALSGWTWMVSLDLIPIFALPALTVLLAILAQRAFVVTPSKLQPKLSRISLIQNAKQKFGRNGFFEFAKSFVKLSIYSLCLALFLIARLPDMVAVIQSEPSAVVLLLAELCVGFLSVVILISLIIGGIDAVWQHQEHIRKNRMSRKEIMDEAKNTEGDPHLKQERRARAQAIASQQMIAEVPNADVVIVNPTHYAVALKWTRAHGTAPECVAKGVDAVALRIREVAMEAGVPIHHDAPTARALHAVTEIGDEVAPEHYAAVAAAIRFADNMRARMRRAI